jgi:acyl-coenzyme A thioesterase PaaI-like protein
MPTWLFRRLMRFWGPFRASGIRLTHLSADWRYARVELRRGLLNMNYVGTHFGGSLFSMTDPFYMLMLMHNLGRDYLVWDKTASIDFVSPGRGTVFAEFRLDAPLLERIREGAASGAPVYPEFDIDVLNDRKEVVARIHRRLYVRLKPERRPGVMPASASSTGA